MIDHSLKPTLTIHGGRCAKRHRMRCRDCHRKSRKNPGSCCSGRYTLPRKPEKYRRLSYTYCPCCGSSNVVSVETARRNETLKKDTCHCNFVPFPHGKGQIHGCEFHPSVDNWTEADQEQYENMLRTPRSG